MDNNSLLMIVLAFVVGFMFPGMMKQMCGRRRLVEGFLDWLEWRKKGMACGDENDVGGTDCGPLHSCQDGQCI